jgi:hypothetical protein
VKSLIQLSMTALILLTITLNSAVAQSKKVNGLSHDSAVSAAQPKMIDSTLSYKASTEKLVRLQQEEIDKAVKKLEELRQLVVDGLVARNELVKAEQDLAAMRAKQTAGEQQIADADRLVGEIHAAEQLEKTQAKALNSKVKLTSYRYAGNGRWSLNNLSEIQSFFAEKFGRSLPTSAIGQSPTHNQLRWDHRNSVDVSLHPDSSEGKALIDHLQSQGIPFLAFRSAIPGVATGPHIHIGLPSSRL